MHDANGTVMPNMGSTELGILDTHAVHLVRAHKVGKAKNPGGGVQAPLAPYLSSVRSDPPPQILPFVPYIQGGGGGEGGRVGPFRSDAPGEARLGSQNEHGNDGNPYKTLRF